MKRYRPLAFFAVALLLGLVTSVLVFSWLQNEKDRLMAAPIPLSKNVQVLVSNADLAWGTKLTPEMLQLQEFPSGAIPEGHFTSLEAIKDRVLLVELKRNELLLESKLAPLGTTSGGVAAVTDPNKRAMSVKVDDVIGVAGFIKPNDRVDVMVTIEPEAGKQGNAMAKMILEKREGSGSRHADGAEGQGRRAETGAGDYGGSGGGRSGEAGLGFDPGQAQAGAPESAQ